ncbi:hypothetical protein J5226_02040 [Lysobacter sp. K5869]|uniref:hypothetical protein n=1 Tax=Lysobacter sp. K5869 TaxID=2820808 RepID=UPI001C063709|nr:hypothetical protein [Lysobacter sp. K5869]QWP77209.1 hypothetical protein J5226_02040 [Lysobacter sp. K5869]
MQNMQRTWLLADQLQAALNSSPLSHRELAERAGVQYYAVRRMRIEGVKNRSRNAVALCNFFGISEGGSILTLSAEDLKKAVQQAWDGSEEQGRLLLELIRSVGQYKVAPKL